MEHANRESVAPNSLLEALAWLQAGHRLYIATYARMTVMTRTTLAKYTRAGAWLLKEEGKGYRLHTGRRSLCILPGQLKYLE